MAEGREKNIHGPGSPEWESEFSPGPPDEHLKRFKEPRMLLGDEEEDEQRDPRERYWSSGLLEKITSRELTANPNQLKWRTWQLLEGVLDRQDDWTARIARDRIASRAEELVEAREVVLSKYLGKPKRKETVSEEFYQEFKETKDEMDAFFTLFIDFGNVYEKLAARGEGLSKAAFGSEIIQLNPTQVLEKVFNFRGFREKEGWPSIGEQIDITVRAYTFLACQSEKRKKGELEWIKYKDPSEDEKKRELSEGFKRLFPGDDPEKQARDWLRRLKLRVFVHSNSKLRPKIMGKTLEQLEAENPEVLEEIDDKPVFNRFSISLTTPAKDAIEESVRELASRGRSGDIIMDTQARIAEKLGRKIFYYFGLASYYGGEIDPEPSSEGHPWSDGFVDTLDAEARVAYNIERGYWAGLRPFRERAPQRMHTHYFKFASGKDPEDRDNRGKNKSLWYEMWKEGKWMGKLSWDRMADFSVKSYWIRYVFLYLEDIGIMPAFMGDSWIDNSDVLLKTKFWINVKKSINIVARDHLIVEGDYQGWVEEHKEGLEKIQQELLDRNPEGEYDEYENEEEKKKKAWSDAIKEELNAEVNALQRRWKKIIFDSVESVWKVKGRAFMAGVTDASGRAEFMKDPNELLLS